MSLLAPTVVHPSTGILLPDVVSNCGSVTQGGLFSCETVAWLVVDNTLLIVDATSGKSIQSWRPSPETGEIVHVVELDLGDRSQLLIVGLERNGCGVLVVLLPNGTRLLRAVHIPESITSIHPFSSSIHASFLHGYCLPDLFQHSALAYFSGIVAVGCCGGKVYLINLHLNVEDHISQRSFGITSLSKLCIIEESMGADDLESIGDSGQHTCVLLTKGK